MSAQWSDVNTKNNDSDVAGIGAFVEGNFLNRRIGDIRSKALACRAGEEAIRVRQVGKEGVSLPCEDVGRKDHHDPSGCVSFRLLDYSSVKGGGLSSTTAS